MNTNDLSGFITPASARKLLEWAGQELERARQKVKLEEEYVELCDMQLRHSTLLELVGSGLGDIVTIVVMRNGCVMEKRQARVIDIFWRTDKRDYPSYMIVDCEWTKKPFPAGYTATFYAYAIKPTWVPSEYTNCIWIEKGPEWGF